MWRRPRAPAAIVRVSASSAIQPGSLAAIRQTFIDHPDVHALIGDALVEDKRQLRAAWSPTASANDPATVDLVATRDGIRTGALADRFDVLGSVDIAAVGHLPVALIARPEPEKVDDRARAAVDRLVNGRRTAPPTDAVSVLIPTAGTRRGDGSRGQPLQTFSRRGHYARRGRLHAASARLGHRRGHRRTAWVWTPL